MLEPTVSTQVSVGEQLGQLRADVRDRCAGEIVCLLGELARDRLQHLDPGALLAARAFPFWGHPGEPYRCVAPRQSAGCQPALSDETGTPDRP